MMRPPVSLSIVLLVSVFFFVWTASVYCQETTALPIEAVLSARSFAPAEYLEISPDGVWVAYTLQDNRRRESPGDQRYRIFTRTGVPTLNVGGDIWITNTKSGESKSITGGEGSNWSPSWSPNGRYMAFYSNRRGQGTVWIWELATGKLREVSNAIVRPLSNRIQWTPDGQHIVVKLLPGGLTLDQAAELMVPSENQLLNHGNSNGSTVVVYKSVKTSTPDRAGKSAAGAGQAPPWSLAPYIADLAVIDINSGQVRRVVSGGRIAKYWISPDGSRIAYTSPQRFETLGSQQILFDLSVFSFLSGKSTVIAPSIQLDYDGSSVSWSPDGAMLSYRSAGARANGDVFVVSATGGNPRNLTESPHPNFRGYGLRPPLWDAAGKRLLFIGNNALWAASVADGSATEIAKIPDRTMELIALKADNRFWSADGDRSVIVNVRNKETKEAGFYRIELANGRHFKLLEDRKSYRELLKYGLVVGDDQQHVVVLTQDAQHGEDLWIADLKFDNLKRVTRTNPNIEQHTMGAGRLISWRSLDGEILHGALLLPSGYREGERYPLIVKVYAGANLSENLNLFGFAEGSIDNLQLFATRGYAVLLADSPRVIGAPIAGLVKSVLPGVNKVIEMGIADPKRLGVMGHSNGGFSAVALITQTTRFKAAVMVSGSGDLIASYGQLGKGGTSSGLTQAERQIGGTIWDERLRYIENSPIFYLDRVETPLLIVHGGLDNGVSPFVAGEVFVGLNRLDKEVVYAEYDGEEHGLGNWSYANQVDYLQRIISWFDQFLR
jgi:dipeptidyl aminopeptidase/acylaminoacyl peptidase